MAREDIQKLWDEINSLKADEHLFFEKTDKAMSGIRASLEELSRKNGVESHTLDDLFTKVLTGSFNQLIITQMEQARRVYESYKSTFHVSPVIELIDEGAYDVAKAYIDFIKAKPKPQKQAAPKKPKKEKKDARPDEAQQKAPVS